MITRVALSVYVRVRRREFAQYLLTVKWYYLALRARLVLGG